MPTLAASFASIGTSPQRLLGSNRPASRTEPPHTLQPLVLRKELIEYEELDTGSNL